MGPKDRQALSGSGREQIAAPMAVPARGTATYTNKDGSKFIIVPKTNIPMVSAQESPTSEPAASTNMLPPSSEDAGPMAAAPAVNRKKQKRRAKAAAKLAAEQGTLDESINGLPSPPTSSAQVSKGSGADPDISDDEGGPEFAGSHPHAQENGYADPAAPKSKKPKRKKKKAAASALDDDVASSLSQAPLGPIPGSSDANALQRDPGIARERIWNTSSQEERERIKQFWLGLGEDERKSLVKVEKDAVLKKMKEQQKHTCSCTLCGRKRIAIEEELEGLYDAYYEELEQYANHPNHHGEGPPLLAPPRLDLPPDSLALGRQVTYKDGQPILSRLVEHVGDDEEEDEEEDEGYSDDDLADDDYSDEEQISENQRRDYAQEFFNFGNSLTVQGGILTVADDLLKNDGKKFIEMMEQLAERRMAREQDAKDQYSRSGYGHADGVAGVHNHPLAVDDEEYDDEEEGEEDYESQEEEFEEEEDAMTEEQRMEEGRRMFQIFAARMFEQRVVTAYKEKVAKERQQKLIEELEEEDQADAQRKARKAKEAQKRKDKAQQKKQALAEEKARKDAEKAAEQEARLAEEERKAEEQRQKAEEKRRKKEAQKKAEDEERLRKEAERLRKANEQKERQAEQERKLREAKDREKKVKEEARAKEKEARERKEQEARERREQQEREREKREKEAKSQRGRGEGRDRHNKHGDKAGLKAPPGLAAVPLPINLRKQPSQQQGIPAAVPALPREPSTGFASPQIPVATPALPKAPTPVRPQQASQQEHAPSSGPPTSGSQDASPHPLTPVHTSPGPIGPPSKAGSTSTQSTAPQSSQATSPLHATVKPVPTQPSPFQPAPMAMHFPHPMPAMPPGFGPRVGQEGTMFNPFAPGFRPAPAPMPMPPPGLGGPNMGRPFGLGLPQAPAPPPGFPPRMPDHLPSAAGQIAPYMHKEGSAASSHSRQPSSGLESTPPSVAPPGHPMASRPAPIGRPSSVVHGQRVPSGSSHSPSSGDLATGALDDHPLGSRALLDGSDDPVMDMPGSLRGKVAAPPGLRSAGFPSPFGMASEPMFNSSAFWGPPAPGGPAASFGSPQPPPGFAHAAVSSAWPAAGPAPSAFGSQAPVGRPNQPRAYTVRQMLCLACQELSGAERAKSGPGADEADDFDVFIPIEAIKAQVDAMNTGGDAVISDTELLDMCDTEGNPLNGGGSFDVRRDITGHVAIRWTPESSSGGGGDSLQRAVGRPGEIGSPSLAQGAFSVAAATPASAAASR